MTVWIVVVPWNFNRGVRAYDTANEPAPAIQAKGIAGVGHHQYVLIESDADPTTFLSNEQLARLAEPPPVHVNRRPTTTRRDRP